MSEKLTTINELVAFLDARLNVSAFDEPESNGLIVRASDTVKEIAVAVNTSFHAIDAARAAHADLLIVHHRSWPEIDFDLVDAKHAKLRENGCSLYCAHSALDGAPEISNGDGLARAAGLVVRRRFLPYHGGLAGVIATGRGTFDEFVARLTTAIGPPVESHKNSDRFGVVAIATGGAPLTSFVAESARQGADTYVTGEVNMYTRLYAKETGVNLVCATHYTTETFGVQALTRLAAEQFGLLWHFIAEAPDVR